jgi:thymidylate synthase (FAD)
MLDMVRRWLPIACEAFEDYAVGGAHLSRNGIDIVRRMLAGEAVTQEDSGLSKREWTELMELLGRE